jgi:hypothetical protein
MTRRLLRVDVTRATMMRLMGAVARIWLWLRLWRWLLLLIVAAFLGRCSISFPCRESFWPRCPACCSR